MNSFKKFNFLSTIAIAAVYKILALMLFVCLYFSTRKLEESPVKKELSLKNLSSDEKDPDNKWINLKYLWIYFICMFMCVQKSGQRNEKQNQEILNIIKFW